MTTIAVLGVRSKIASVVSAGERFRKLKLTEGRRRRRYLLTGFMRSWYSSDISCYTIRSISGRGNERVKPVHTGRLRQLIHSHTRQRTMASRSFVAHRLRVSLMSFGLARDLVRLLPRQDVASRSFAGVEALLVADDPAVRLTHLLEVVD